MIKMLRLRFQKGLVQPHCRKSLLAVQENWKVTDILMEVGKVFGLTQALYLEVDGYCLADNVRACDVQDVEVRVCKTGNLMPMFEMREVPRKLPEEREVISKLPDTKPVTAKRELPPNPTDSKPVTEHRELPHKRTRSSSESSDESLQIAKKQKLSASEKKAISNKRKEMKKTPKLQQFTGKKVKFDADGRMIQVDKITNTLNILSPAEEFVQKKQSWRIPNQQGNKLTPKQFVKAKPPPKQVFTREAEKPSPEEEYTNSPSHESSDYDKQRVKRFGEYEVERGSIIPEIYKYNLAHFEPCTTNDLVAGNEILFKTLELDDRTLTPAISGFKRGRIVWSDEKYVNISLLREFLEEELDWLKDQEIIDEHILEKYELTLEKVLLADLRRRKTDTSDMDIS